MTQPLKAHVRNGQVVLDDPNAHLPEGAEVELHLVEGGEFEPEERARLIEAIEEAEAEVDRGEYVDGSAFIAELRAKREATRR